MQITNLPTCETTELSFEQHQSKPYAEIARKDENSKKIRRAHSLKFFSLKSLMQTLDQRPFLLFVFQRRKHFCVYPSSVSFPICSWGNVDYHLVLTTSVKKFQWLQRSVKLYVLQSNYFPEMFK